MRRKLMPLLAFSTMVLVGVSCNPITPTPSVLHTPVAPAGATPPMVRAVLTETEKLGVEQPATRSGTDVPPPETSPTPESPIPTRPAPVLVPSAPPEEAGTQIDLARQDLARRLGIAPEQIALVRVEAWTWPNASLGCPEPRLIYRPIDTPGYLILLEGAGRRYEYHTDYGERVVYCPKGPAGRMLTPLPPPPVGR